MRQIYVLLSCINVHLFLWQLHNKIVHLILWIICSMQFKCVLALSVTFNDLECGIGIMVCIMRNVEFKVFVS